MLNTKKIIHFVNSLKRKICSTKCFCSFTSRLPEESRVVVTGMGIVCPLGVGIKYVWKELLKSYSSVKTIEDPLYNDIPCKVAAFVPVGEESGSLNLKQIFKETDLKKFSLSTAYALVAAKEALEDANWFPETDDEKEYTGVSVGTGMVDLEDIISTGLTLREKGYSKVSPYFVPRILCNMPAGHIAIKYNLKGPNHSASTACATGLHAIGDAYNFIRNKQAKVMVCGSSEAVISPLSLAGFARMRALATNFNRQPSKASRPFDKDRDGFVMGEGAGILVIESLPHAVNRKAQIYAEVIGYGLSGDAYHITSPCGTGAYRCMAQALLQNHLQLSDVGYINAHATSTPLGDTVELKAINGLFQKHSKSLVVSSTKGATGHLLGAAGSIEAIFTVMACHSQTIPPNVNLENPDIPPDITLAGNLPLPWLQTRRVALTNSFGFGGTNASVVFCNMEV